jgi:predicted PurR-regulated permease PerM
MTPRVTPTRPAYLARLAPLLSLLLFGTTTASLVWPLYPWLGNHVEPRILGIPWSLSYVILVIAVNTAALVALYMLRAVDASEHPEDGPHG